MAQQAKALDIIARLRALDEQQRVATEAYITPITMQMQELMADLGAALSGFALGDVIYSPTKNQRITITHLSAGRGAGTWYWIARGLIDEGVATAYGFAPEQWRLVK